MTLINSNTYIEPTAATAIALARSQYNDSMRSILTNFASSAVPTNTNTKRNGNPAAIENGMLFYHTTRKALYIADSTFTSAGVLGTTYHGPGKPFTRHNMLRHFDGIADLYNNIDTVETGELVTTVTNETSYKANGRLYLSIANTAIVPENYDSESTRIIDVGIPPLNSITNDMIQNGVITEEKLSGGSVEGLIADRSLSNTKIAAKSITKNEVDYSVDSGVIPLGTIIMYPAFDVPAGWLRCGGQLLDSVANPQYAALYSVIGTSYGGTGAAAFSLPNFEARLPIGLSTTTNYATKTPSATAVNSSGKIFTDQTVSPLATTSQPVSQPISGKDITNGGTVVVIDSVVADSHNHDVSLPLQGVYFIIRVLE